MYDQKMLIDCNPISFSYARILEHNKDVLSKNCYTVI